MWDYLKHLGFQQSKSKAFRNSKEQHDTIFMLFKASFYVKNRLTNSKNESRKLLLGSHWNSLPQHDGGLKQDMAVKM